MVAGGWRKPEFFRGRTAVITGGASGIGRALGEELARRGAIVVLADINLAGAEEVAHQIVAVGGEARAVFLDVTDAASVKAVVDGAAEEWGRLDYMFNNAGIAVEGEAWEYSLEDWRRVLEVNLLGVVHGVAAAYPLMVKQGFGHIVNTGSLSSFLPLPLAISYATAKHGVLGLSITLRSEAAELGVKVSVTCPGFIDTRIYRDSKMINFEREKMLALLPKMVPPEKCARDILAGVEKNRAIIVTTVLGKLSWVLYRMAPGLVIDWLSLLALRRLRTLGRSTPAAGSLTEEGKK